MDTSTTDPEKKLTDNARLKKLEQQQEKIRAAIAREKAKLADQARKDDTRRKILAGALILTEAEKDSALRTRLHALLEAQLTRADDRALFDLAPLPAPGNENGTVRLVYENPDIESA